MGFGRRLISACLLLLLAMPALAGPYVAGGAPWKPYAFEDENGHLQGVAVDIARRVMQLAKLDVTFVSYPVNRLQSMLHKGEIDISYADAMVWNSPEEQQHYVFSKPYSAVNEHLYFLADNPARAQSIAQLDHLTVGMVRGYTYWALDSAIAQRRLTRLETSQEDALIKLLQSRRVDAIAMVDDIFDALVDSNHLDSGLFRQGAKLSEAALVLKLQPQYAPWLPRINRAIDTLRSSGELDRIKRAYVPAGRQQVRAE